MCGDGGSSAEVDDDEVGLFVALAEFAGDDASGGLLVEGVPDAALGASVSGDWDSGTPVVARPPLVYVALLEQVPAFLGFCLLRIQGR